MFRASLSPLYNLRHLSLHGFIFSSSGLRNLLVAQLPAIRTLRLLDCYCEDTYASFAGTMRRNLPKHNKLEGVEIFGVRFKRINGETEDHELAQEYREKTRRRCSRKYNKYIKGEIPSFEGLLLSDWPYERPELEAVMLGDRANTIVRKIFAAENDEARWNWMDMPSKQA